MNGQDKAYADPAQTLIIRDIGRQDYIPVWDAMRRFTDERTPQTPDEIWFLTHNPVFTQGQAGKAEHLLTVGDIPVVQIDRGGQVTYHGPGQLVVYLLLDLRRLSFGARQLVDLIENAVVDCLRAFNIVAETRTKAPGVYVKDAKIAALGFRIRKGCSYHGLSLNAAMDLSPFSRINPCGYRGLQVTNLVDHLTPQLSEDMDADSAARLLDQVRDIMLNTLVQRLGHTNIISEGLNQSCRNNNPDAMS
jgi:lipoyl(octanoyl) transferase